MFPPVQFHMRNFRNLVNGTQEQSVFLQTQVQVHLPEYSSQSCTPENLHKIIEWVHRNHQNSYQNAMMRFTRRGIILEYQSRSSTPRSSPFSMLTSGFGGSAHRSSNFAFYKTRAIRGLWVDPTYQPFLALVISPQSNHRSPSSTQSPASTESSASSSCAEQRYFVIVLSLVTTTNRSQYPSFSANNQFHHIVSKFNQMMRWRKSTTGRSPGSKTNQPPPGLPSGSNGRRRQSQSMDRRRCGETFVPPNNRNSYIVNRLTRQGSINRPSNNDFVLLRNAQLRTNEKTARRRSCSQPNNISSSTNQYTNQITTDPPKTQLSQEISDDFGRCDEIVQQIDMLSDSSEDTLSLEKPKGAGCSRLQQQQPTHRPPNNQTRPNNAAGQNNSDDYERSMFEKSLG